MTTQNLIVAKYRSHEIMEIEELVRIAFELGKLNGKEEALQDIPIHAISQAKGYQHGYEEGVKSVDMDKVKLSHLIPESGLQKWNEMTPNERMEKMHKVWAWQKSRQIN